MDFTSLLWVCVAVVFGIIGAHWAGLDPFVRLGLKTRRPTSSRILAKPSPAINTYKSKDGLGAKKFNQEAGRLRVPQSPSNRPIRAVPNHVATPIPPPRVGSVRPSPVRSPMDVNGYEDEFSMPMVSPRASAYQLTRVPSSPALSAARWSYQPDGYPPNYGEFEVEHPFNAEYYVAGDGTPIYLETQIPPPYIDDLPERKQPSRRKRSDSFHEASSEYGGNGMEDTQDAFDVALASYPRSGMKDGRSRKKVRDMTDDDRLEFGRESKISGKNSTKRRRHHMAHDFDDTRSDTGSIVGESRPKAKRPRLHESNSQIDPEEFDIEENMFIDDDSVQSFHEDGNHGDNMSVDGETWAVGPSQMRHRQRTASNLSSSYSAAKDQQSMSKSKAIQRSKHKQHLSSTESRRKVRQSSSDQNDETLSSKSKSKSNQDEASSKSKSSQKPDETSSKSSQKSNQKSISKGSSSVTLQPASSSLSQQDHGMNGIEHSSMMSLDPQSQPAISAESSSGSLQSQGSSVGYGGLSQLPSHSTTAIGSHVNSAAPSTNHSPTRPETSNAAPFGIPLHSIASSHPENNMMSPMASLLSTPSSLAASSRQARLQMLRDQSHTLTSTPTGPSSISRIPLTNSASKRSLEPPMVSFTPVPSIPATPMPASSVDNSPTKPEESSVVIPLDADTNEPEEDARISHMLKSAHQRKEDKDMKQKEIEEKVKQASAFKLSQATAANNKPTLSTTSTNEGETNPETAITEGAKPAFAAPKLGFKPLSAAPSPGIPAADGSEKAPAAATGDKPPAFKAPGITPKVPSFGTPSASATAGAPKTGMFGPKPVVPTAPAAPAAEEAQTSADSNKPAAAPGGAFRFGGAPSATATAPVAHAANPTTAAPTATPGAGLFKSPASLGATTPAARPSFGASASAAPASSTTGGFGAAKQTGTPSMGGFGQTAATTAAAPASQPGVGLFGSKPVATPTMPTAGFGAQKPAGSAFGAATSTTAAPAASPSFGAAKPGAGLFGSKPAATMPTGTSATAPASSFGAAASRPSFGASAAPTSAGMMTSPDKASGFGQQATAQTGFGQQTGGFGQTSAPASSFGAKPATTGFGAQSKPTTPATPARAGAGLFGSAAPVAASPVASFGASSKPGFGASSGAGTGAFGATSSPAAAFGASRPTSTGFGATSASTGFGAASAAPTSTGFGASTPGGAFGKPAGGTGFGASTGGGGAGFGQGASTGTAFGSPAATRPGAGLFGSSSASSSSPATAFGASSGTSSPAPSGSSFASTPRRVTRPRR